MKTFIFLAIIILALIRPMPQVQIDKAILYQQLDKALQAGYNPEWRSHYEQH